jgi:Flp pilus assembly protein TadD
LWALNDAGLVKAQLGLGKNKEATACAREALAAYPRCSEAHILMGTVLAQNPSSAGEVSKIR